ncbi:hypothetical protein ACFL4Z_02005 [candidate division KSB1 bacterium]
MKCKKVRKYFSKSPENKEILEHLEGCGACRKEYREFLALRNVLKKGHALEEDELFWKRYVDEIENKLKNIPRREKIKIREKIELPMFLKRPVYAAAAVIILITGIFTYHSWINNGEDIDLYSNSLGFFIEEFENVTGENVFIEGIPFDDEYVKFLEDF